MGWYHTMTRHLALVQNCDERSDDRFTQPSWPLKDSCPTWSAHRKSRHSTGIDSRWTGEILIQSSQKLSNKDYQVILHRNAAQPGALCLAAQVTVAKGRPAIGWCLAARLLECPPR